jgi:phage terminase small subunit
MAKLSEKQRKFCEHYAKLGNATESAKLAGYSEKTAYSIGDENLRKPELQEYLKTLTQPESDKRIADAIERQQFLTEMMRGKVIESDDAKNADRLKACVELGKLQGDYIERHQVEAVSDITIHIIDD